MRDIPIKNSYIATAILLYWFVGYIIGLTVAAMAIQTVLAIAGTVVLYICLGGSLGGGVCKGLGVSYLWLGFSFQFLLFVCLCFFFIGAIALGMKIANPKANGVPALPVMLIIMGITFPNSEMGARLVEKISEPHDRMAKSL